MTRKKLKKKTGVNNKGIQILIIVLACISVFISTQSVKSANKEIIPVKLEINYGEEKTQDESVTLKLKISDPKVDTSNLKVQFAVEDKAWRGYNHDTNQWALSQSSRYQMYYPNFYLGSKAGERKVYVKVQDNTGKEGIASGTIVYAPIEKNPTIELGADHNSGELSKGTEMNPYFIRTFRPTISLKANNASHYTYSTDKTTWSGWQPISNGWIEEQIIFDEVPGLKTMYIRVKNNYGIESPTQTVYYLLDNKPPKIDVSSQYASFIAADGQAVFNIELLDDISSKTSFTLQLKYKDYTMTKSGVGLMHIKNKPTRIPVQLKDLPTGNIKAKITAKDEAGNTAIRDFLIKSY